MKRHWFSNTNKGSYELSSDNLSLKSSRDKQHKSTNDLTNIKVSPLPSRRLNHGASSRESTAAASTSTVGDRLPAHNSNAHDHVVAIPLKETAVGLPKRMHRRQKSSGNWKMLLNESEEPTTNSAPESLAGDVNSMDPVRKPVSTKQSRPLSFFQQISQEEPKSTKGYEHKQKRGEVFPWSENLGTPSPSASSKSEPVYSLSDKSGVSTPNELIENGLYTSDIYGKNEPKDKVVMSEEVLTGMHFEKPTRLEFETKVSIASAARADSEMLSAPEESEELVTVCKYHEFPTDNDSTQRQITDDCPTRVKRSIHDAEQEYVQRNSDPSSMKKKRAMSDGKRRSYPLEADSSSANSSSVCRLPAGDMEVKCEILKISNFEADGEVTEDKTFVLLDPKVKSGGSKPRVCIKTFSETKDDGVVSERYKLAEATGETIIDTSDDSVTSTSASLSEKSCDTLTTENLKIDSHCLPSDCSRNSSLKRSTLYKSSLGLSVQPSTRASFDEQSISSEKESLYSSISTKSYSVNDLTLLERPSGFCTLDMKKMLGSFRMLDNIISEYTTSFTRKSFISCTRIFYCTCRVEVGML